MKHSIASCGLTGLGKHNYSTNQKGFFANANDSHLEGYAIIATVSMLQRVTILPFGTKSIPTNNRHEVQLNKQQSQADKTAENSWRPQSFHTGTLTNNP